ncbi:tRNA (adenosine(37)-N6)-dimethylallyltransferase MiaA [Candidatus Wolfebacteria bacterium]|nr:tRNA (adenosine(37)-N6)-dimethylallyltransferase MiaA [Candidatus Wolfebacteria bacterium]
MRKSQSLLKIIVILGPTASGKSDLAVRVARRFDGEVISADSRQVYKGLDIGSGKVPRDKKNPKSYIPNSKFYFYKGIRHHLLDVASPKQVFSVSQYQKLASKAIKDIIKRKKIPIICGGTGFYIDSLIYDYKLPEVKPDKKIRAELEKKSTEELFKQLKKLDPRRAKNIDRCNRRRLIRALEICLTTGKPTPSPADIRANQHVYQRKLASILKIGVKKPPEELKKMIYKRLIKRLNIGMIKEVKNLHEKQKISWKRLDDLGLEYRYVSRYLHGLIIKKEMIDSIQKESEKYAKRQMTWFKRDKNIIWINSNTREETRSVIKIVKKFLTEK